MWCLDNEGCADSSLHLQSRPVDMCLNNGTDCGLPAATAFCKYLGFDGAIAGTIAQEPATTATRALTGTARADPDVYWRRRTPVCID